MKVCTKCRITKSPSKFNKKSSAKDGLQSWCKECNNKNLSRRQKENPKKGHIRVKRYRSTLSGYIHCLYHRVKQRCESPKHPGYKNYGGRGIKCLFESSDEFVDYIINELRADARGLDIDRIDNNGHYEKGNIRFVTRSENLKNRKR